MDWGRVFAVAVCVGILFLTGFAMGFSFQKENACLFTWSFVVGMASILIFTILSNSSVKFGQMLICWGILGMTCFAMWQYKENSLGWMFVMFCIGNLFMQAYHGIAKSEKLKKLINF